MAQHKQKPTDKQDREPQFGEKPKPGQQQQKPGQQPRQGGDPRTLPGSQDLGDQSERQDQGGMVKGT